MTEKEGKMAKFEKILNDPETGDQVLIKSNDYFLFEQKVHKQLEKWKSKNTKLRGIEKANQITRDAKKEQDKYLNILKDTLARDDKIEWESLKDCTNYAPYIPPSAKKKDEFYLNVPKPRWIERLIPGLRKRREKLESCALSEFNKYTDEYSRQEEFLRKKYENDKDEFIRNQMEFNKKTSDLRISYESGNKESIESYINMVLEKSEYPDGVLIDHTIEYIPGSMSLKIQTELPIQNDLNLISEAKYISSKDEFQVKQLSKTESKQIYKDVIHQIVIRTIHEIFESEYLGHIQRVEIEGVLKGLDTQTGIESYFVLLNVGIEKSIFEKIQLDKIEYESCLEGIGCNFKKDTQNLKRNKTVA
jgi:restriction system protein